MGAGQLDSDGELIPLAPDTGQYVPEPIYDLPTSAVSLHRAVQQVSGVNGMDARKGRICQRCNSGYINPVGKVQHLTQKMACHSCGYSFEKFDAASIFGVIVAVIVVAGVWIFVFSSDSSSTPNATGTSNATVTTKSLPRIVVHNPFDNARFSWKGYDSLGRIEGTIYCTESSVRRFDYKIYDAEGRIVYQFFDLPRVSSGQSAQVHLVSNSSDISEASKIEILATEE